jgi:hypothetical protein
MSKRRRRWDPMPAVFHSLSTYNSELARGLLHTPEWKEKMAELQRDFDAWTRGQWEADGYHEIAPGLWSRS